MVEFEKLADCEGMRNRGDGPGVDENLFRAVGGAGCGSRTYVACELLESVV